MRITRYLALLLIAAFAFSGCSIIKVNPERDGKQIVAEINGEQITKKQVYDAAQITWDQKIESWDIAAYKKKKEDTLNSLIQDIVTKQKAKELGYYSFTAEEQKTIDDAVAEYKTSNYDKLLADYTEKAKTDPTIKPEESANADIEKYKQQQADQVAYGKAEKVVTDPISPSDADVKTVYDSVLAEQKTAFDKDASQITQYDTYGAYGYPPVVYYPIEGFVRVKHILVVLPDDVQTKISNLRKESKNDEANKLREDELKKIEAKATEALTKAKDAKGDTAKLDALITEYGKDPGMISDNPGYLVYKDSKDWAQEFTDTAMKLTDLGTPSELVATDYGYHILWLTEKVAKGDVPLEKVKDKMKVIVKAEQQNTAWQNTITGWMDEYKSKIVTHLDRLHN